MTECPRPKPPTDSPTRRSGAQQAQQVVMGSSELVIRLPIINPLEKSPYPSSRITQPFSKCSIHGFLSLNYKFHHFPSLICLQVEPGIISRASAVSAAPEKPVFFRTLLSTMHTVMWQGAGAKVGTWQSMTTRKIALTCEPENMI